MSYSFRPAQRSHAKPIIGLYSQSGCGKTMGALLLARGFVGPTGRIGMIETESGRGEAYADPTEYPEIGGYEARSLRGDFSPKAYHDALVEAEEQKFDALIVDSCSHEWDSTGGVLDMAAAKQAAGAKGVLVWQEPKILHKRHFMLPLTGSSIPLVILCMRAKYPMEEKVNAKGYKDWVRSTELEPIQADDMLFEMFIHGWVDKEHNFHLTKCTSKSLEPIFGNGRPLSVETGRQLAGWANGAKVVSEKAAAVAESIDIEALRKSGEYAARRGNEVLDEWIKGLTPDQKSALMPFGAALRAQAKAVDERAVGEPV